MRPDGKASKIFPSGNYGGRKIDRPLPPSSHQSVIGVVTAPLPVPSRIIGGSGVKHKPQGGGATGSGFMSVDQRGNVAQKPLSRPACYLCETPKTPWAVIDSLPNLPENNVVCRSCVNFEGVDR